MSRQTGRMSGDKIAYSGYCDDGSQIGATDTHHELICYSGVISELTWHHSFVKEQLGLLLV